ncbi:GNAT family N-acetyltransferase [Streptomyces sp. BI20]|uniref:GNAT family N-acetyltransferase n=1 Tax=Streptomyces sp. BI20 TaxID=3403460 RepID=UPI003C72499E
MEFTAGGLLELRVTPADVGKRVSVRQLDPTRDGGPMFTDTVGVLTSWNEGVVVITRKSGEIVRIPESALVAGKVVPAAPVRRRGPAASYAELNRVAARAWQPVESELLGEWTLRAANGFTKRANSVLPVGDPGIPVPDALARVTRWYAERGLRAGAQVATGSAGTQETLIPVLRDAGWVNDAAVEVRIGSLAPLVDSVEPGSAVAKAAAETELAREPDAEWLERFGPVADPDTTLRVLTAGPSVWFAKLPGRAIGRLVVDGRWAGFFSLGVDPAHRRRGLGRAVMHALAERALAEGASAGYLQVESDNDPARALYAALGWQVHHLYHHYRAPAA